jgi:hypothetical protein
MPCSNLLRPNLNLDTHYIFEVSRDDFASGLSSRDVGRNWGLLPTVNQR